MADTIRVKPGVQFSHISFLLPEVMRIIYMAQKEAPEGYAVTITSGCEGKHMAGSRHYKGKAFDFRIRDFPGGEILAAEWSKRVLRTLGTCYRVLLKLTHLHVSYLG